jgi:hypothetical protein
MWCPISGSTPTVCWSDRRKSRCVAYKANNHAWIRTRYFPNTSLDYDCQLNLLDPLLVAHMFRYGLQPSWPLPASKGRIHVYVGSPTWYGGCGRTLTVTWDTNYGESCQSHMDLHSILTLSKVRKGKVTWKILFWIHLLLFLFWCMECQRLAFLHHTSLNLSKWLLNTYFTKDTVHLCCCFGPVHRVNL